jgi:hypothetical protein
MPPTRQAPTRGPAIVSWLGDWRCACGATNKLWDTCACGQGSPCRQVHNIRTTHTTPVVLWSPEKSSRVPLTQSFHAYHLQRICSRQLFTSQMQIPAPTFQNPRAPSSADGPYSKPACRCRQRKSRGAGSSSRACRRTSRFRRRNVHRDVVGALALPLRQGAQALGQLQMRSSTAVSGVGARSM